MSYRSTTADRRQALTLGVLYVILALVLAVMLFKIWPPTPWPKDEDLQTDAALARVLADCECPMPTPSPRPVSAAHLALTPSPGASPETSPSASPTDSPAGSPTNFPTATPAAAATPPTKVSEVLASMPIRFFGWCIRTSFDERLLLLVIIAGMLGSFVHGATSLADYIGNNNFNKSWSWFYLLRPVIGMALALVFYFVIRGGFLTTSGGAKDINPYGIAALAGLVGMFSKQATDKLSEVFGTLFRSAPGEGDAKRSDSLTPQAPVTVTSVDPATVPAGTVSQRITVTGTNFLDGAQVYLNDQEQETTFVDATKVTASLDDALLAAPATLTLKVVNEDGNESAPIDFVVT